MGEWVATIPSLRDPRARDGANDKRRVAAVGIDKVGCATRRPTPSRNTRDRGDATARNREIWRSPAAGTQMAKRRR
jgi:hypothetical protein